MPDTVRDPAPDGLPAEPQPSQRETEWEPQGELQRAHQPRHARAMRGSRGRDPLGLRRVLSDRLLPGLVAAMALLAALALGGAEAAAGLAARWRDGAAAAVTVQLPDAQPGRVAPALAALAALPEVAEARFVDPDRMAELLAPWLGGAPGLPLPGLIELRLRHLPADPAALAGRIAEALPGAVVEAHGVWVARLAALAGSLQALAFAVLALVAGLAAAVVAVAVRAGLAARREAIAILHELGATDAEIAGRFAAALAWLAGLGGLLGTMLAVPVLASLAGLAAPLAGGAGGAQTVGETAVPTLVQMLAPLPWAGLALLPPVAAGLGWLTAQATVRRWLHRLP